MKKQRKHGTPSYWEKEDSGDVEHSHREVKNIDEKKVGQEPMDQEVESLDKLKKEKPKS
jgi:hypothetical protein